MEWHGGTKQSFKMTRSDIKNEIRETKMTSARYPRCKFKICHSWQDNYTTAWLSEIRLQEMETRNDQSHFHYICLRVMFI